MRRFPGRRATGNASRFANTARGAAIELSQLKHAILRDPKRCDLEILDTFIGALDPELIQTTDIVVIASPEWKEQSDRALQALAGIAAIAAKCNVDHGIPATLVESVVDRLVSGFHDIVYWMRYLLHFGYTMHSDTSGTIDFSGAYMAHSHALFVILSYSPRLDECFQSSPSAIDLVLQFWVKKSQNGEPFAQFMLDGRPTSCPILRLMLHCVNTEEGIAAVVDRVHSKSAHKAAMFIKMTTVRSEMVYQRLTNEADGVRRPYTPPQACFFYYRDLSDIVFRLIVDKRIWDGFLRVNFVANMTRTAVVLPKHSKDSRERMFIASQVFRSFLVHSRGVLGNLEAMLEPEFFGFFMSTIVSSKTDLVEEKPDSPIAKFVDGLVRLLDVLSVWPRILKRLETSLGGTQKHMWVSVDNLPSVGRTWRHFHTTVEDRLQVDATLDGSVVLCDNPYCRSESVLLRTASQSKKCSACRSVAYCSKSCQQQDWNTFHRDECNYARLEHRDKKRCAELYTPRMRAFHLALMERRFNLFIARHIDRTTPDKRPENETETGTFSPSTDLATSQTKLYTFDASQAYSRIMCVPPGSYEFRELHVLDEPWVQRRFEEGFLRATGECDPNNGHPDGPDLAGDREAEHFVEGVFVMGDKEVLVMVKMRVHTDKDAQRSKFCAASSVVRIGQRRP